ncbi:molybdopterin-dependent oxidoreductase [Desulfocurvibacter africanus]|uniref:Nitrate reductase n=1 Tax=Desulfocurvibacter africanus subsp. africanus str. Walvis Bay TaxID=690850 RepID=F3YV62_DESAF|nr:molybdopterin-dependent oxidoreductase [Desulfocurvibacter africanus]EGJ48380.1 Nitrate reductase [Desulfocurvibacter africanus subsp. africanus str. Walvis Bay]
MTRIVKTACTRHCSDGCALCVEFPSQGRPRIRGNPDHPFTAGVICAKTARYFELIDSPTRITTPLVRDGEEFRQACWDEALDLVASRIQALRATPERILHVWYYASFGVLAQASRRLFGTLRASGFTGSPCLSAGAQATIQDFGAVRGADLSEFLKAARIVNWGRNVQAQSPHLNLLLRKARRSGISVLAVHVGDQAQAGECDRHILVRPGTDRFLAAAVLKLLLERGTFTQQALERSANWNVLERLLRSLDYGRLLDQCGAREADAELLADWYGRAEPVATLLGRGLQRYTLGGENVRFVNALAMASGHVGKPGGGIFFDQGDLGILDYRWAKAGGSPARTFRFTHLAQDVERADPPVDMIWVEGMNLVTQGQDSQALARMLRQRFCVVVAPFMTDTAECASVILPPALMLETEDLCKGALHDCVLHAAQVLQPRGEARSNFDIAASLAARLSLEFPTAEEVMRDALRAPAMHTSLEELRERGWAKAPERGVPWADGHFAHPDGKYRFPEALHEEPTAPIGYPLRLLSLIRKDHLLSQIPEEDQTGLPSAYVSPDCATLAELDLSKPVFLSTPLGRLQVRLELQPGLHPEVVLYPRGDWLKCGRGVNRLIEPREADFGGQAAYYSQQARLENGPDLAPE